MFTNNILAYVAGIIDGEGYISLKSNGKYSDGKKRYAIVIKVTNTDQELINFLYLTFGGHTFHVTPRNPRHNESWIWEACSLKAYNVIKVILPYLRIKKPQAQLAIEYQERRIKGHTTFEKRLLDERDVLRMKSLQTRGKE